MRGARAPTTGARRFKRRPVALPRLRRQAPHGADAGQQSLSTPFTQRAPHREFTEELRLFGQFVGSWDVEVINYLPDGTRHVMPAEGHFGWVLEGRAIQDV